MSRTVEGSQPEHRNEVVLVGRVAAPPELRTLPSGDIVALCRLVVARPRNPTGAAGRAVSDTLECAAWTAAGRRTLSRWSEGDVVEVQGALHRRFWRSGQGVASRYEVRITSGRRLGRSAHG